jgi:ATP-dependent RNA helicase TDRD9
VSQPRKIAAMSIARRVSNELKSKVGGLVGYQVGLDKKLNNMDDEDEKTQILFCTTGVILQKLIKDQNMEKYTHIILDEIHERDIDTDLLMTILK